MQNVQESVGLDRHGLNHVVNGGCYKMGERVSYTMAEDEIANAERCVEDRVLIFTL